MKCAANSVISENKLKVKSADWHCHLRNTFSMDYASEEAEVFLRGVDVPRQSMHSLQLSSLNIAIKSEK
jgi:hypothetical protein